MSTLIADSGSTKTDWRVVNAANQIQVVQTDGLNPYYQTTAEIIRVLQAQLLPQISEAGITDAFFYGTGCTGPSVNAVIIDALQATVPDLKRIDVNSDMIGAARATVGHQAGIACILGTGSNACCYEHDRLIRGIQSLGFWLGDEGSGGYLGKTLVRDYFQGRLPAELHEAFQTHFKLDRLTLLEHAYKQPFPNRYFAAFTPFLSTYLAHPYLATLVTTAFSVFLETYVKRFPEAESWPVHFVGSIAHYFAVPLQQAVRQSGLLMGSIRKAPVDQLVEFHKND